MYIQKNYVFSELHAQTSYTQNFGSLCRYRTDTSTTVLDRRAVLHTLSIRRKYNPLSISGSPSNKLQRSPCSPVAESLQMVASHVVAYHFCQVDNAPTCSVPEFVHSLAAQLSQAPALRPYYNQLMTDYELRTKLTRGYCLARPDQALEEGILEPLRSVQGLDGVGASPCMVVVDGLCDSEPHRPDRGDSIGSFLSRHLDSFPAWIKFLVTIRSDARGQTAVKGLPFHQIRYNYIY